MDILRAVLVVERYEVQTAIGAFHSVLSVLCVVVDAAMSEQIALVVGISELLCAEHIEVLRAQARVKREKDFLRHIHRIVVCDSISELHVIALRSGNSPRSNLCVGNRIETVKEIECRITVGIAHTSPDSLIQMFRERLGDEC